MNDDADLETGHRASHGTGPGKGPKHQKDQGNDRVTNHQTSVTGQQRGHVTNQRKIHLVRRLVINHVTGQEISP